MIMAVLETGCHAFSGLLSKCSYDGTPPAQFSMIEKLLQGGTTTESMLTAQKLFQEDNLCKGR